VLLDAAVQIQLVPSLGVTNVVKGEIVLSRPEERHRIEPLEAAEYISRRRLSLAFSHHPVLDANMVPGQRIGPARDISGCVDLRNAALEVLVHQHALVGLDASSLGKIDQRPDADSDHDQVGLNRVAVLENEPSLVNCDNTLLQMEHHAVAFVQTPEVFAHLRSENSLHRHRLRRDDVDLELSVNQRSRNLHRNEARAYQHDAPGLGGLANNRAAITQRAQVTNLR